MNQQKPISHIVAGLIIAGVLILLTILLYYTGMQQTGIVAYIPYAVIILGLITFINMHGKAKENQVSFGNLFSYGFKTTAVITLVMVVFTLIFFILFPEIKEKLFETARQQMEEAGNRTQEEIDTGIEMWQKMFWVFTFGGIIFIYAIVGAIGSAIGAAITKKKPINPMDQLDMR